MSIKAIPATPLELEEFLGDKDKIQNSIKDGSFSDVIKAYAKNVRQKDESIAQQVHEQVQATLAEFLKENGQDATVRPNLQPNDTSAAKYTPVYNPRAAGAGLDKMYSSAADFFQQVWHNAADTEERRGNLRKIKNIMQEKVPSDGGFLVPEEFRSEILRLSLETAIVRPRARVIPMGSARLSLPTVDSTTNAGSVYGGVIAYWTEEGAQLTQSQPNFGRVSLDAKKLTAFTYVTNELVRDWGAFGVFLNEIFPEAVSYYEDLAFLSGNGVGQPLGVLNSGNQAIIQVSKEASQATATLQWENIVKMYARMLPSSISRAVWIASPDTFAQLALMTVKVKNVAGTENVGGSAVWLPDAHGAPQLTLLGRPVIMSEKAPAALGTKGDLSFVDLGMYLIGDRQTMTVDSSEHVRFDYDETAFRVVQRVDGRPWLQSAITPQNSSATLSPFVQLETR